MLNFIEEKLSTFRTCFSRTATYRWFVVIIIGLMTRTDFLGITSIIRCLFINPKKYESLIHFFRWDSFFIHQLKQTWHRIILHDDRDTEMIRNRHEITATLDSSYLVLDRYFLTVPALTELNQSKQSNALTDIITRVKNSCTAYYIPDEDSTPKRGRPRKKGASVKLNTLFQDKASEFIKADVFMYGKKESVEYLCLDLLWGIKLYRKLRFVLVKSSRGNAILVSTDLTLESTLIIEAYAHRFKIESTFREFKQQLGGFCYHFWTKAMPKLKKYWKKTESSELVGIENEQKQHRILKTIKATECFILCASIAMGLTQMMALTPSIAKTVRKHRYLRTSSEDKVSEATVLKYLRKNFFIPFLRNLFKV